jgi:hypothetical protein
MTGPTRSRARCKPPRKCGGKIFGTIDTREKFLDHRAELAAHEWARMKANDSLECRNCHSAESMDFTRQSPRAVDAHQRFLFTREKTCIDCHKGIAHRLPDAQYPGLALICARGAPQRAFCARRLDPVGSDGTLVDWKNCLTTSRDQAVGI